MRIPLANTQPGYFEWRSDPLAGTYLYFNCPCGCPYLDSVRVIRKGETHPHDHCWDWDGDPTRPTLSPSLKRNVPCKFHGYLERGVWRSCGDGAPLAPDVFRAP